MKSFNASHQITVPANGGIVPFAATGSRFYCLNSTGKFSFNYGSGWIEMERGLGERLPGGEQFTSVQFRNDNAFDIQIRFMVGTTDIIDLRPFQTPETVLVGHGVVVLATRNSPNNADRITFAGISNGLRRKQFILSNSSETYDMEDIGIYIAGVKFANIRPGASLALETDQEIEIRNLSDSAVARPTVGEIFYK